MSESSGFGKAVYQKDGERQERAEWHRIQDWRSLGEYAPHRFGSCFATFRRQALAARR
jgi:hypothetical protein